MSLSRFTRQRLYQDEKLFNGLLPYVKWDYQNQVFLHSDASLWSIWQLNPLLLTGASDAGAYHTCFNVQSLIDSMDHQISVQFNWITSFDVNDVLNECIHNYPLEAVSGWMARRWVRMFKNASRSANYGARVKKLRLLVCFRYDPQWKGQSLIEKIKRYCNVLLNSDTDKVSIEDRMQEYKKFVDTFRGEVDGKVARFADLGLYPTQIDGQGLINILYPLLNRQNTKGGKFKRGRYNSVPVPLYDPDDILSNQISDTPAYHSEDGYISKGGRVFHAISMVKPPKRCLPLITVPLQSTPYESILSVTYSKDPQRKQMQVLDRRDALLGLRERGPMGRSNQKIRHQISVIRAARDELYNNKSQIVRVGVHHVQITQNIDEARRAASEMLAMFPAMNDARGMSHMISDLGVLLNALPGAYDPATDGPGWTTVMQSSRAARLFPLWGNWKGSRNSLFVLPNLWNRELVGFDLYDSNTAPNVIVTGVSGAGKSYLLNFLLITLNRGHYSQRPDGTRQVKYPITFVFDKGMPNQPCGFERVAKLFGGRIYQATPSRAPAMNFLARVGEMDPDRTNEDFKDLLDICVDVIVDMATEKDSRLGRLERNEIVESVLEAHYRYRHGPKDREFLLRDILRVLKEPPRPNETEDNFRMRQQLAILMREYYGDGTYARFFDRPGALELKERFIVFDLKGLSRNPELQRVFLKVAMLWADEVMNDPSELDTRKILVFDEAHDLVGKTAAGVVESAFRLYRKRKGIVIAASQSGEDFYVGEGGQAIIQNSSHKIFLKQDPSRFHLTAQAFSLNQQQANTIMALNTVRGVESQFFLLSDIGEAALVLPLEPSYYWVSTNNGDDNQLFAALLDECDGDFFLALQRAVDLAPRGADELARRRKVAEQAAQELATRSGGRALNLSDGTSS
ncbi:MAG: TraC family protein [Deltaproteobacteria bacterium]|nr:TraC family protein [Deltaproteobacteria bacterium]